MQSLIGTKKSQSQRFLENGTRIPVTLIDIKSNWVVGHKTADRDNYQAVQLGFSMKKKASKAELGHAKGANLEKAPKFLREVKILADEVLPEIGTELNPVEVLSPGDIVNVSGFSKGKGFAGGVKRHGFHGGPKTHGQSDRHRAPGSIGQGTTPGRVYKGKRMAGRMGNENVTIQNLEVVDVTPELLTLKGLVPGIIHSLIVVKKVGTDKKFVPLWRPEEVVEETTATEEAPKEQTAVATEETPEQPAEASVEEPKTEEKLDAAPAQESVNDVEEDANNVEADKAEATQEAKEEVTEDAK